MKRYIRANTDSLIKVYCVNDGAMSQYRHIPEGSLGFYCSNKLDAYLRCIGKDSVFVDEISIIPTNILDTITIDGSWTNDSLQEQGYDCIRYTTDAGEVGYVILNPHIIDDVRNNTIINFGSLFRDLISSKSLYSVTTSDIIYMTNGMRDTCLAYFDNYEVEHDRKGYTQYCIYGKVILNLNISYYHKPDSITNEYNYSSEVTVVSEIPEILLNNPYNR